MADIPVFYELYLTTDAGVKLRNLNDFMTLDFVVQVNRPGWATVQLPPSFDIRWLNPDQNLQIWRRRSDQTVPKLMSVNFMRRWQHITDSTGNVTIKISGPDVTELLERRIVAYVAGSSEAQKAGTADDLMKAIVDENFVNATDTDRNISNFTISPDLSAGRTIDKGFAWRGVQRVLRDLTESAKGESLRVMFRVEPVTPTSFQFVTWVGQRMDRSWGSANPALFSLERGNLAEPRLEIDYSDEVNYVYTGGQGEGEDRAIVEREGPSRIAVSIWNRREAFRDARNTSTTAALRDEGDERVRDGRPVTTIGGILQDTEAARFGQDWQLGDRIGVEVAGQEWAVVVRAVRFFVDAAGNETLESRFEVDVS